MRIGFNGSFLQLNVSDVIDEVHKRIEDYEKTPSEAAKQRISTCFYEIFELYRFLKEPENYMDAGPSRRKSLVESLGKWQQLDPEDNQIDEWIRTWEHNHGGLF